MQDYLSIYLEQEKEKGRARRAGGLRSFEVRCTRASALSPLACEIRNYRDDSEQLGSSTGREWCTLQRGRGIEKERGRSKENGTVSRSKCMRTRGDNANARRALYLSLSLSLSSFPFTSSLFLSSSFSFSLLSALTCWCGLEPRLEVNSRVHLRSTRWIIQRTLTVLCAAEETTRTQRVNRFRKMKHRPRTISAECASFLVNFVRSCLCMIAEIPFANGDRKR